MTNLQQKVKELDTITGCLGGFVARGGTSVASGLPAVFDRERLDRVAAQLKKLAALADKSGYPSPDFVLRFGKATLLVQSLGDGAHLVLACEPNANLATVEVFASVAADDIREALAHHEPEPDPVVVAAPAPDPRELLEEARRLAVAALGSRLSTAKALLVSEVGPIGDIIFASALDEWLLAGPIDWSRSDPLRDRLAAEIDHPATRARFTSHAVWRHA